MKNSRSIIVGISGLILNKNEISILKRYLPIVNISKNKLDIDYYMDIINSTINDQYAFELKFLNVNQFAKMKTIENNRK